MEVPHVRTDHGNTVFRERLRAIPAQVVDLAAPKMGEALPAAFILPVSQDLIHLLKSSVRIVLSHELGHSDAVARRTDITAGIPRGLGFGLFVEIFFFPHQTRTGTY